METFYLNGDDRLSVESSRFFTSRSSCSRKDQENGKWLAWQQESGVPARVYSLCTQFDLHAYRQSSICKTDAWK